MSICIDVVIRPTGRSSPPGQLQAIADELNEAIAMAANVPADQRIAEPSRVPTAPESVRASHARGEGLHEARYALRSAPIRRPLHRRRIQSSQVCARIGISAEDDFLCEGGLCPKVPENLREVARCIARLKRLGVHVRIDMERRALPGLTED